MTYNTLEISNASGRPVALYEFRLGETFYRYTTNDTDLTLGDDTYLARAISDGGVKQGGGDNNDLLVQCAANLPVAGFFRGAQPSGKLWLTVYRYHVGDAVTETPIQWLGTVTNSVLADGGASATLHCRSLAGTYDRNGLRLTWDRSCPHFLYGNGCKVDKADHAYPREIATLTGVSFTCTAHAEPDEGSFSGGFVEWERLDGSFERRGIELQDGNDFQVLGTTTGLEIGSLVTLYPGCARTTANCILFDNLPNYGGFPHLPGQSPFDGTQVF